MLHPILDVHPLQSEDKTKGPAVAVRFARSSDLHPPSYLAYLQSCSWVNIRHLFESVNSASTSEKWFFESTVPETTSFQPMYQFLTLKSQVIPSILAIECDNRARSMRIRGPNRENLPSGANLQNRLLELMCAIATISSAWY